MCAGTEPSGWIATARFAHLALTKLRVATARGMSSERGARSWASGHEKGPVW